MEDFDRIGAALVSRNSIRCYGLVARRNELDSLVAGVESRQLQMLLVIGERLKSVDCGYDELAAALQLPLYFGRNLNALRDSIDDLRVRRFRTAAIMVVNSDQAVADSARVGFDFVDVLAEATSAERAAETMPILRPVKLVLHASGQNALLEVARRLHRTVVDIRSGEAVN